MSNVSKTQTGCEPRFLITGTCSVTLIITNDQKWKKQKYMTIGQSNGTFVETCNICTSYTHIHDSLLSWLKKKERQTEYI